jgi:hypothetical protein
LQTTSPSSLFDGRYRFDPVNAQVTLQCDSDSLGKLSMMRWCQRPAIFAAFRKHCSAPIRRFGRAAGPATNVIKALQRRNSDFAAHAIGVHLKLDHYYYFLNPLSLPE